MFHVWWYEAYWHQIKESPLSIMVVNRDSLITHSFQLFFIGYLRYNISTVGLRLLPTVVNWFVNTCDVLPLPQIYEVHCTRNVYGLSCWNCFRHDKDRIMFWSTSGDCISWLIPNKRLLGNWYGNSIVILVTLLLTKKILNQHVKIILCIPLYRPNAHVITVETEQT